MPGVLMMIIDKNWGDVKVDVHKDTIEWIQMTNITISNTAFDGFGSKISLEEPSNLNLDLKGFNSTVNFLFEVKLWLGSLSGNLTLDISDASLAVGTSMWNDDGALQLNITNCHFDIGTVKPDVDASWTYEWILKLLLPSAISEVVKLVNSDIYKIVPALNKKLAGLDYKVAIMEDIMADLHVTHGPAISKDGYIYAGLNSTVYNSSEPYNPGYTPETLGTTFGSSVALHISDYVPSVMIAMFKDFTYDYFNANLTTSEAAIVLP